MYNTKGKLNTELEPFIWIAIFHGIIENGWCIAEQICIVFRHGPVILHVFDRTLSSSSTKSKFRTCLCNGLILLLYIVHIIIDAHSIIKSLVANIVGQVHVFIIIRVEIILLIFESLINTVTINVVAIRKATILKVNLISSGIHFVFLLLAGLQQLLIIHIILICRLLRLSLTHTLSDNFFFNITAPTFKIVY